MVETYDWDWGTFGCLALFLIKILHDYGLKILQKCLRLKKERDSFFKFIKNIQNLKKNVLKYISTLNVRHGTRDWKTASNHRREFLPCPELIGW